MKIGIQLFVFLVFISCNNDIKKTESNSEKLYFDLAKIVQTDIDSNLKNNCAEEKIVFINGDVESKKNDTVDWNKELQILIECDLNMPNWKGKYDVQVLNDHQKYVYTANSSKIPIRTMTVNYEQQSGRVISVEIDKKISTNLFTNEQHITYLPNQSFKIKARQSALFMKDFNSEVEIKYLCNK